MTRRRSVAWVLLGSLALALVAFAALDGDDGPGNNAERTYALAEQFACPVCQGQSVADSDVPIAREIRREIRTRLDQGQTEDQIRQYLTGIYEEEIDLVPSAGGVTGLVWVIPVVGFASAMAGLGAVFWRWRREQHAEVSEADRDLVERVLAGMGAGGGDGAPGDDRSSDERRDGDSGSDGPGGANPGGAR